MITVSTLYLLPVLIWIVGEGGSWPVFYHYVLVFYFWLVLHEVLEVDCGGTDWFFLALPELAREVLPLQQFLVSF